MSMRRRGWVTLGLYLAVYPRRKSQFSIESVMIEGVLENIQQRIPEVQSLRPDRSGAIFSGTFPEWADKQISDCRERGVTILTYEDRQYPRRLRNLPDPPPCLYVSGTLPAEATRSVAVVGSRRPTPYGRRVAVQLGKELGAAGVSVVSGLARGIDTAAHQGALESGGRPVGVLGCGVDVVYPKENNRLYNDVVESGGLVTEYPLGMSPQPHHFPIRNRIIAALGEVIVVVEAAHDSGSLITASLGADLGRPVAAVPGQITSGPSRGCNDLIFDGAHPVRDIDDVLGLLPSWQGSRKRAEPVKRPVPKDLDAEGRKVLKALDPEQPMSIDSIATHAALASRDVLARLLDLELRGLASQEPGGLYLRKD